MQLFKGKIVYAEDKVSKNGNNFQLMLIIIAILQAYLLFEPALFRDIETRT